MRIRTLFNALSTSRFFAENRRIRAVLAAILIVGSASFISEKAAVATPIPLGPTTRAFTAGAYIVDMGQPTQTVANGVKPYGLVYDLSMKKKVPVSWAFSDTKLKDGVDFLVGAKSYSGSVFIIPAAFATEALPTINIWKAKGVVVDGPTTTPFSAPIYGDITSFPRVVLDTAKGSLAVPYYVKAEIPSTAYRLGDPASLTPCDDMYVMPHADPTWATHSNLATFNQRGGFIWAGCHSVSVLEGLDDPADADTLPNLNFLTTGGLIPFKSHANGTPPYSYALPSDPNSQFLGTLDAAQQNGSEQIYIPSKTSAWRPTTKVLAYDPTPAAADAANSGGKAATLVVGPGFGDPNNGYVMYEGGHALDGTAPENVASMRAFLDFHLLAGIKAGLGVTSTVPSSIDAATTVPASATATGGSGTYTYKWVSNCGGTFSSATAATTNFTAPTVVADTPCNLKVIVTDGCGRVNFDYKSIIIKANQPADVALAMTKDIAKPSAGDVVTYTVSAADLIGPGAASGVVVTDLLPSGVTLVSAAPSSGSYTAATGVWTIGSLALGSTVSLQLKTTVNATAAATTITNAATVTSTSIDPSTSNNAASVTFTVNRRPIANPDSASTPESTAVTISLFANDEVGDGPISVYANTSPAHGTIAVTSATGSTRYVPTTGYHGMDSFTYSVKDIDGDTSTATVTIAISSVDDAPVAVADSSTTPEDTAITVDVLANDSDADGNLDPTSVSLIAQPGNGVAVVNSSTGKITYTPRLNFNGVDVLTYQVCDKTAPPLCATAPVTITVTPVNDPISPTDDVAATPEDTPAVIDVLANDSDVEGIDTTSLVVATTPGHGAAALTTDHAIKYSPALNFSGVDTFTYNICDNSTPASCKAATVRVTVAPVTDGPAANADSATTPEDTSVVIDVLNNDIRGDLAIAPATVIVNTTPIHGTATVDVANGKITYVPNRDYHGTDSLSYRVCDVSTPELCSDAPVTITVTSVNDPVVAQNDALVISEDSTTTVNVLANDHDPDSNIDLSSLQITTPPNRGTTTVAPDGVVTYTATPDESGTDTFTYKICDTGTPIYCDSAVVTVTITPVNDPPKAQPDAASTTEGTPVLLSPLDNDSDVEGPFNLLALRVVNGPMHGTATVNPDGTVKYSPIANFNGTDQYTYQVCDTGTPMPALCVTQQDTIVVTPVNDPPVAQPDTVGTPKGIPITTAVLANDVDVDGNIDNSSVTVSIAPTIGTASVNPDGSILYSPTAVFVGTVALTYKVCDTGTPVYCTTATLTIAVSPVNHPPIATNDDASVTEDQPTTIDVAANDSDTDSNLNPSTVSIVAAPLHGATAVNSTTGVVTYTPATNFVGTDSFTYRVCDTGTPVYCATAIARVVIDPVNDAPVPAADESSTPEDTTVVIAVVNNDADVDGNLDPSTVNIETAPTHGVGVVGADHTIAYTPNQDYHGIDTLTYSVCDTGSPVECGTATVTITVTSITDAPQAKDDSATTPEDTPTTVSVLTNDVSVDGPLDPTSLLITSPTNGSVVVGAGGTVVYTPQKDFNGPDSFTYSACATSTPVLCTTATVAVTVTPVNDPPVANDDSTTTPEDTAVTLAILSNDSDVDSPLSTASVSIAAQAAHGVATFDPLTRSATYTPTANYFGIDSFTYELCDVETPAACDTAQATIIIAAMPDAPVAVDDVVTTPEDTLVVAHVLSNDMSVDGPLNPATVRITTAPAHGTVSISATSGDISYTPAANYNGSDKLSYEVCTLSVPRLCDVADVLITINPVNDAPQLVNDSVVTPEDTPSVVRVLANDSDIEGPLDLASLLVTTAPNHGSTSVAPDGTITYSPALDFNGLDTFTYTVCDTSAPAACPIAVVSVTVLPQPDAPIAKPDAAITPEATPVIVDVLGNDRDPDGNLDPTTLRIAAGPSHGTMVVSPTTHDVTYTPTVGFNGSDTATYQVCDSGTPALCATALISLTVTPVNDPPVAIDDSSVTPEDTAVTVSVLNNDTDPDLNIDPSSVTVATAPSHGVVSVHIDGTVTYKPNVNFYGSDLFTYNVCDLGTPVYCDKADVAIAVTPINDAPVASDDHASTNEATAVAITVTSNDTDVEGPVDATTVTVTIAPVNGAIAVDGMTGVVTYTPIAGFRGTDTFTYEVCDLGTPVLCASALATIVVTPVNGAPDATDDTATTAEDTAVTVEVLSNDTDRDGNLDPASLAITVTPLHGDVTVSADQTLLYIPAKNYFGSDLLTYTVCDLAAPPLCSTAVVTIDVTPVNDAPVASDDASTTPEDLAVLIDALSNDTDIDGVVVPASLTITNRPSHGTATVQPGGLTSYQPTADFFGVDQYTYEVCDDGVPSLCDTALVTITVTPVDDPPVANDDVVAASAETPVDVSVLSNDTDVDANIDSHSVKLTTPPLHGSAVANVDGTLTYTPAIDYLGTDTLRYSMCDTGTPVYCSSAQVTLAVSTTNIPPVAVNDTLSTKGGVTETIGVLNNDTDANNNLVANTLSIVGLPVHGVAAVSSGTVIYVSDTNYVGTDTITYRICDSGKPVFCATALINVTVIATATPPQARDDFAATSPSVPVNIDLLANDSAPEVLLDPSTVTATAPTFGGRVVINPANGVATYSPDAAFFRTDTFTYKVCDRATKVPRCTTANVTVLVQRLNQPPVAEPDSVSTQQGVAVTLNPLKNDHDIDGALVPSTLSVFSQPAHGEVTLTRSGEATYTPTGSYHGIDTFTYQICDDGQPSLCARALVTITITPLNAPVDAQPDTATTAPGQEVTVGVLANDSDVDGVLDAKSVTIVSTPHNGAATVLPSGSIRYVPSAGFVGVETFVYRVCNQDTPPQCAETTVTITVGAGSATLELGADTATTSPSKPVTIAVLANDRGPIDPQTLRVASPAEHGLAAVNPTGTITYQPAVGYVGTDKYVYEVCAATDHAMCASMSVAVDMPFDPTVKDTAGFTGTLFEDVDEDGKRQPHERGLIGQRVILYALSTQPVAKASDVSFDHATTNRLQAGLTGVSTQIVPAPDAPADNFVAITDSNGRFAFDGLPPGKYKIVVPQDAEDLSLLLQNARIVDLKAGHHDEDVAMLGYHAPTANRLAFTGANLEHLPLGGFVLVLSGALIVLAARRRRKRS